jgi:pyroglutamyl-peptidase
MWDEYADKVDAVIHIGMANGWNFYSVEERAFREGMTSTWWSPIEEEKGYYMIPDDVGKVVKDISEEGGKGMWEGMPMGLATKVNVQRVVADVMRVVNFRDDKEKKGKQKIQVQVAPHFEAGSYMCGFIYYESLATIRKRKLDTKVMFCHVPGWEDSERLERGADVICAVIGAICKQIQDRF